MLLMVLFTAMPVRAARDELRIALLPIIDSFPYHVAQQEHLFEKAGIRVDGLFVSSAVNRDQLMQSGEIDGMLNELMTTANFNRRESRVKIAAVIRAADDAHPLFRILGAPGSTLRHPADLADIPIGISRNTIIEYVTDRLLQHAGIPENAIRKASVPSIPERYQLLLQGRLQAATLPDPLAQSAMASGAVLLIEKIRLPANVQADYRIPPFAYRQVPSQAQWQDVMTWMVARRLLDHPIDFHTSVAPDLLDEPGAPSRP